MNILAGAGDVGGAFAAVAEQVQASVVEVRRGAVPALAPGRSVRPTARS